MGRRGPRPQPTRLKLLRGNPGKRKLNEREPKLPSLVPSCPRWLSKGAKQHWREILPWLKLARVLTRLERDALVAYCETYSRWKTAVEFLAKHGEVYPVRDEKGNVTHMKAFPQVQIARDLLNALRSYQQEFGMTPSARTRVYAIPEPPNPEDERFFGPSRGPWR